MVKLHDNELDITANLVFQLLKKQCPQWADLPLQPILSSGTDNAIFRLGS